LKVATGWSKSPTGAAASGGGGGGGKGGDLGEAAQGWKEAYAQAWSDATPWSRISGNVPVACVSQFPGLTIVPLPATSSYVSATATFNRAGGKRVPAAAASSAPFAASVIGGAGADGDSGSGYGSAEAEGDAAHVHTLTQPRTPTVSAARAASLGPPLAAPASRAGSAAPSPLQPAHRIAGISAHPPRQPGEPQLHPPGGSVAVGTAHSHSLTHDLVAGTVSMNHAKVRTVVEACDLSAVATAAGGGWTPERLLASPSRAHVRTSRLTLVVK